MLAIISSSGWPIWPLLIISVLGLAILLERSWFLRRKKISPEKDLEQALTYSLKLNTPENTREPILEADLVKLAKSSPLGQILATGLKARQNHRGQLQCLEEMRELANPTLCKLNQYLNILATIAAQFSSLLARVYPIAVVPSSASDFAFCASAIIRLSFKPKNVKDLLFLLFVSAFFPTKGK